MGLEELRKRMKGVLIVQTTPFKENGDIDFEGLKANTRFLVQECTGRDFILVPVGSTGEFYALSEEEHKAVIKTVVAEAAGKVLVFPGTAQAGTRGTLAMSRYAQSVGADGVQIVLPYYHIPSEEGMYQHYKAIAEGLDIGVIIYNNPVVSGSWIRPHLMARLAEIENIIADKENTPDIMQYYQMQRMVDPKKMAILCGLGELMFSFECMYGCPGFVSWVPNFAPGISYELYQAAVARDMEGVRRVTRRLGPLYDFVGKVDAAHPHTFFIPRVAGAVGYMYMAVAKAALDLVGLGGGKTRLPLVDLTREEVEELRRILFDLGLPVK